MYVAWIVAAVVATAPLAPAPARHSSLTCAVTTPAGRPLTFTPRIGLTVRHVTARGNLQLTGCTGAATQLSSGWVSVRATAQASCTSARHVRGRAMITWFGATGRPLGTSRLRIRADRLIAQHPADTLLTGTIARGALSGVPVRGSITPPTALLGCATQGMGTLPGDGHITFG
ncbi:hypothetical protein ITP53_09275 [Nonomuraea sp. K274]|uniref:Uncharacterized protein n=1 Tax=Nonomuraea cypriaca TaxID=1187855 RepID=A0A931F051_9ACTN|nr:hypothetical protein [Nonomuraea cypriaca]MBF8185933.1 hypothetical protein [Nonomuraea cypriaca]